MLICLPNGNVIEHTAVKAIRIHTTRVDIGLAIGSTASRETLTFPTQASAILFVNNFTAQVNTANKPTQYTAPKEFIFEDVNGTFKGTMKEK